MQVDSHYKASEQKSCSPPHPGPCIQLQINFDGWVNPQNAIRFVDDGIQLLLPLPQTCSCRPEGVTATPEPSDPAQPAKGLHSAKLSLRLCNSDRADEEWLVNKSVAYACSHRSTHDMPNNLPRVTVAT